MSWSILIIHGVGFRISGSGLAIFRIEPVGELALLQLSLVIRAILLYIFVTELIRAFKKSLRALEQISPGLWAYVVRALH